MKQHRWVVVVTLAMEDREAEESASGLELLVDVRRPKSVTPVLCFDCGDAPQPVRAARPRNGLGTQPPRPVDRFGINYALLLRPRASGFTSAAAFILSGFARTYTWIVAIEE